MPNGKEARAKKRTGGGGGGPGRGPRRRERSEKGGGTDGTAPCCCCHAMMHTSSCMHTHACRGVRRSFFCSEKKGVWERTRSSAARSIYQLLLPICPPTPTTPLLGRTLVPAGRRPAVPLICCRRERRVLPCRTWSMSLSCGHAAPCMHACR
jgi:hypothetical protein